MTSKCERLLLLRILHERFERAEVRGSHPNLVYVAKQVRRILVNAVRTGAFQFVLAIASGQQADTEGMSTARSKQIPNAVSHNNRSFDRHVQTVCRGDEEVGVRLRVLNLVPRDYRNLWRNAKSLER